jgi:hypothetical protein
VAQSLPDVATPGTSLLGPLKVLQDCQQLLRASGLRETGDADDDGRVDPGQKTAPTLVPLAALPSDGAATHDDFPSQRQLARHLARRFGPAASLRDRPVGDHLPPIVEALARGRAAGTTPYKIDPARGTTWSRDRNGAPLDPTRQLHYRPMAALFHLWVPPAARLRRDELAVTLCQWAGMVVAPARDGGLCPGCTQPLDPCGHHLQVCPKRASFMWCHQIWQGFFTDAAANIPGVKVVTSAAHGLPHERTTRGRQPDALITVPTPPGNYGPLLHRRPDARLHRRASRRQEGQRVRLRRERDRQGLPRQGVQAPRLASGSELLVRAGRRRDHRRAPPRDATPPLRLRAPQDGRR